MKQRMSPCETWFKASQQYGKLKVVILRVRDLMQAAFISKKKKEKKRDNGKLGAKMWKSVVRKMAEGEDIVTGCTMTCFVLPSSPRRWQPCWLLLSPTWCSKPYIQLQPCCVSLPSPKKQFLWHLPSLLTSLGNAELASCCSPGLAPCSTSSSGHLKESCNLTNEWGKKGGKQEEGRGGEDSRKGRQHPF